MDNLKLNGDKKCCFGVKQWDKYILPRWNKMRYARTHILNAD